MKILVMSDSHFASIAEIPFAKYDYVIHCGDYGSSLKLLEDKNVLFVRGNCDSFGPEEIKIALMAKNILILHGHHYGVKFDLNRLFYKAKEANVSICFYGHTHQQAVSKVEDVYLINPGSFPDSYIEIIDDVIYLHQNGKEKKMNLRR